MCRSDDSARCTGVRCRDYDFRICKERFFAMKRTAVVAALSLLFHVAAVGQEPDHVRKGFDEPQLILSVLTEAGVSASVEYSDKCGVYVPVPELPPIRAPRWPYSRNPVDTLRAMFSVDGRMAISRESNGTVRMVETGVQTDILHVRISHLAFDKITEAGEALALVLNAPEVQSFMLAHGIRQLFDPYDVPIYSLPNDGTLVFQNTDSFPIAKVKTAPNARIRSLSGELNDVTLADALDYLLKAFPGFWLYQDCKRPTGQRNVYIELFPIRGRMWWGVAGW